MSDTQPVSASDILSSFEQSKPSKNGAVSGDDILSQFKLSAPPEKPNGSNIPVPFERMTPAQKAEYAEGIKQGKIGPDSWLSQNYHPFAAIPQTFGQGTQQITQGLSDLAANKPASAVGNLGMGALTSTLGTIFAPATETFRAGGQAIGQPHAAEVASLALPMKGTAGAISPTIRASNDCH